MRRGSLLAFLLMVAGLLWLIAMREIFGVSGVARAVQISAVALMIAARLAFGRRSFHAAANPTQGGIVTSGPYRWIRHPIYAAVLYFTWATALDHHTVAALAAATVVTAGAVIRIMAEERLLVVGYPVYAAYAARTPRIVPFVF